MEDTVREGCCESSDNQAPQEGSFVWVCSGSSKRSYCPARMCCAVWCDRRQGNRCAVYMWSSPRTSTSWSFPRQNGLILFSFFVSIHQRNVFTVVIVFCNTLTSDVTSEASSPCRLPRIAEGMGAAPFSVIPASTALVTCPTRTHPMVDDSHFIHSWELIGR
jgi:hypothetical protein